MSGRKTRSIELQIFETWCKTDLTLKELARRYGVGFGTVSRVIRGIVGMGPGESLPRTRKYVNYQDLRGRVHPDRPFNAAPHTGGTVDA